jgi:hypothetical protein
MANELREGEVRAAPSAQEAVMLPLSMVLVQLIVVGMLVLSKLALNAGMSPFVIIVYRNLIAAAAIAPLAFIFERYVRIALLDVYSFLRRRKMRTADLLSVCNSII